MPVDTGPIPIVQDLTWPPRRRDIQRIEVAYVALVHLVIGSALLLLPVHRVVGAVAADVLFGVLPEGVWGGWFLAVSAICVAAARRGTPARISVMWVAVAPLISAWVLGFGFAVAHGGPLFGLIAWLGHLVWWSLLALRLRHGGTGARWGGS